MGQQAESIELSELGQETAEGLQPVGFVGICVAPAQETTVTGRPSALTDCSIPSRATVTRAVVWSTSSQTTPGPGSRAAGV